jgi:nucleotide-binding universal stress UspA family protein
MSGFERILVTTDFSETSRHVFPPVVVLARKFGARLLVVHVVEDRLPPFVDEFTVMPLDEIALRQRSRAAEELLEFVSENIGDDLVVERIVLHGTPHLEIVKLAEEREADLIAMATHGRGFFSHTLFGSTTERVVRRATCPVLTVRSPEHPEPGRPNSSLSRA